MAKSRSMQTADCKIIDFRPEHQETFHRIYRDWFIGHFRRPTEPVDEFVLAQPEKAILAKNGAILVATEDDQAAGFVALKRAGPATYELTKMAVRPESRGRGLGEALCRAILGRAAALGATKVILYSHSSLREALRLYRKLGFQEVTLEQGLYSSFRCDIKMEKTVKPTNAEETLDPADWSGLRQLGHRMVDDMMNYLESIGDEPAWRAPTPEAIESLSQPLPIAPQGTTAVYDDFLANVRPFNRNNIHPRYWSWVDGGGTPFGMLADMLASGMNANLAIGNHAPAYVEQQVVEWCKEIFHFPATASGVLTSGASMANITALVVARNQVLAPGIKEKGLCASPAQLLIYGSVETHSCLVRGAVVIGIGGDNFRKVPVDAEYRIRPDLLRQMIGEDRAAGHFPFCVIGNAGTVNTGAIDDLGALAEIARQEKLWFHVDGAFGAVAKLLPELDQQLKGIEAADSLSFDFHKWFYVNYEVGAVLIRDAAAHREAFCSPVSYLATHERGLAGGPDPLSNYGMELSKGFRALKVWMLLKEHGIRKYERQVRQNLQQAQYLSDLITAAPELELLAAVSLNIVCYRYNPGKLDDAALNVLNKELLLRMQEQGIATPSYTVLNGRYAIRVAITNHRSTRGDFEALVEATVRLGRAIRATR